MIDEINNELRGVENDLKEMESGRTIDELKEMDIEDQTPDEAFMLGYYRGLEVAKVIAGQSKKEYIIVDSLNQWLLTTDTKEEAEATLKELKAVRARGEGYGEADEIGDIIYLYEGQEIKRSQE